jgi:hypothetical protein
MRPFDTDKPLDARRPKSVACPSCGSTAGKKVKSQAMIAWTNDRMCKQCGTIYTPPTPIWGRVVFGLLGLPILLAGIGGLVMSFAVLAGRVQGEALPTAIPIAAIIISAGCFYQAFKSNPGHRNSSNAGPAHETPGIREELEKPISGSAPSGDLMKAVCCPYCNTKLPPEEITGGWCETCGKQIPRYVLSEASTKIPSGAGPSEQKGILPPEASMKLRPSMGWAATALFSSAGFVLAAVGCFFFGPHYIYSFGLALTFLFMAICFLIGGIRFIALRNTVVIEIHADGITNYQNRPPLTILWKDVVEASLERKTQNGRELSVELVLTAKDEMNQFRVWSFRIEALDRYHAEIWASAMGYWIKKRPG